MPNYTAPLDDMLFLFEKLRDNKNYNELEKYNEVNLDLVKSSHKEQKGVITLCHMSAPEAKLSYDMQIKMGKTQQLYQLFLNWALTAKVDGIVVGATFPKIIQYCSKQAGKDLSIFSPGVGTQGGNASEVISSGTNYLIVGRTILNAKNSIAVAKELHLQSIGK